MKINAVAYWSEGGDGGGGISLYNSLEELKKEQFDPENFETPEDAKERYQSALNHDDYEAGEISNVIIEITVGPDGVARLAKDLYIHYGQ